MEASRKFTKDSICTWVTDYLAEVLEVESIIHRSERRARSARSQLGAGGVNAGGP